MFQKNMAHHEVSQHTHSGSTRRKGDKERRNIQRNYFEKLPKFIEKINLYIEDVQQMPSRINKKRLTNRQIGVKMLKVKDKREILKAARKPKMYHL